MAHGDSPQTQTFDFSSLELYNPAYIPTFARKDRFLHYYGSAGSGKSVFVAQKEIILSFKHNRRGRKTIVARRVYNTVEHSVFAELNGVIDDWGLRDCFHAVRSPFSITNLITGVRFVFIGLDDIEKVKSFKGADRGWLEEATEVKTRNEVEQLGLRLRGFREVQWTLTYNPIDAEHWLNKEIHEQRPVGHYLFKSTYRDNLKLLERQPDYPAYIESMKDTNPNYYRVYGLGEWGRAVEGLVYPEYTDCPEMPCAPQAYGLDFGYNDPTALCAIAVVDEPGKAKKQLYVEERLYETKHTSDSLIRRLNDLKISRNVPIIADSSRPDIIDSLRKAGFYMVESVKGAGSVKAGINTVKLHDLRVVAGSKNAFKELGNYSWKNKNGIWLEEPQDGVDHILDGMRYATTHLTAPVSSGSEEFEDW